MVEILSYWHAEQLQGVRGSDPGLVTSISEIEYLLLPSHDMIEIVLRKAT